MRTDANVGGRGVLALRTFTGQNNYVDAHKLESDQMAIRNVIKSVVQVKGNFSQRICHIFGPTGLYAHMSLASFMPYGFYKESTQNTESK